MFYIINQLFLLILVWHGSGCGMIVCQGKGIETTASTHQIVRRKSNSPSKNLPIGSCIQASGLSGMKLLGKHLYKVSLMSVAGEFRLRKNAMG